MRVREILPWWKDNSSVEGIVLEAIQILSTSSVRLTWSETVISETGFSIQRSEANGDFVEVDIVGPDVITYDDTLLTSGVFRYRIKALGTGEVISNTESVLLSAFTKEYRLTKASSEYLSLPHGSDVNFLKTNSFTYQIYVKWASSEQGQFTVLFSKTNASGHGLIVYKSGTNVLYINYRGTTSGQIILTGSETLSADRWYLITLINDGTLTNTKAYVDDRNQTLTLGTNNLVGDINTVTPIQLGARAFSVIYSSIRIGFFAVFNKALDVNEVPNQIWNYGVPRSPDVVSNCVRLYGFNNDSYGGGSYTVVGTVGVNGSSSGMSGDELVNMNSVEVQIPTEVTATPRTTTENTIYWKSSGYVSYTLEVSDDGVSGWTTVESAILDLYYHHNVGSASTTKYYRVTANGNGVDSAISSPVVSATTLSSSYTDTHYYSTLGRGDNSYYFGLAFDSQRTAPTAYYDGLTNRTWFVFMSRAEVGYDMAAYIYYYDHATETFSAFAYTGVKTRISPDRHQLPAIIVADDGHILLSFTDNHNNPLQIWRSTSSGLLTSFTKVTELGLVNDYPKFRKMSNGDIFLFSRYYSGGVAGLGYFKSTDDGLTWGAGVAVLEYAYANGRPYATMCYQSTTTDRIHLCVDVRNDTGGPFPLDPDKVGYFKDMGYLYSDDGITWHNVNNSYSKNVVGSGAITEAQWQANFQFLDSVGTVEPGLAVSVVTEAGAVYISHYKDDGTYNVHYHNGATWVTQSLTFPDSNPNFYSFAFQAIQVIRHITGDTFDIYCTKDGVVKRYRSTDKFATLTLADGAVMPDVNGKEYERGMLTFNIYEAPEPFLMYALKVVSPNPLPTGPGGYSDVVLKKLW